MKQYTVEIEIKVYISIDVNANNEDEAKEKASEITIVEYSAKTGHSNSIAVKSDDATILVDSENLYEKIIGVTEF